jgi:hypothetical protein
MLYNQNKNNREAPNKQIMPSNHLHDADPNHFL